MATNLSPRLVVRCQNCDHTFDEHEPFVDKDTAQKCKVCKECPGWVHIAAASGRAAGRSGGAELKKKG